MMPKYTIGEVKAIVAPIMGLTAEEINDVVIMVAVECDKCVHDENPHDMVRVCDTLGEQLVRFMAITTTGAEEKIDTIQQMQQRRNSN